MTAVADGDVGSNLLLSSSVERGVADDILQSATGALLGSFDLCLFHRCLQFLPVALQLCLVGGGVE